MRGLLLILLIALCPPLAAAEEGEVNKLAAQAARGTKAEREKALGALGQLRHPRVGQVLRQRFLDEPDAGLRGLAGFLLAERHVQSYYRVLKEMVDDGRKGRVPYLVEHAVNEDARYLRSIDLWAAASLDPKRTSELLAKHTGDRDISVALRAIELTGLMGRDTDGKAVMRQLKHANVYVRIEAVLTLAKLAHVDCDSRLGQIAVKDATQHARRHATWALYQRGSLRARITPFTKGTDGDVRRYAFEALAIDRIKSLTEEGPRRHRFRGRPALALGLFRRGEMGRGVTIESADAVAKARLEKALSVLGQRSPKFAHFVRYAFSRITTSEKHPTGTYVTSRLFNIKASTVRKWSYDHLAKTLVHDATHAWLEEMGEKSGEHRGEEECFQEAFWADKYLRGLKGNSYDSAVDELLKRGHWVGHRRY